ncbi:hypothetical protein BCR37DRAFT_389555 [Protomyces lactucae-debilis]|uniref:Uncharacterized protein n=1 Tax=Protomyces lactucae-debilis TaxID=2754530 RepID=A0A1Y2EVU9_PROLT|nr:uncharacterized protein BCR37DRAFT_389555 [Protomyces lactucae-debilis]ORY75721.1 hypothetical protein BCR37DRAFT_389555 [Protomyces lactucae-debilis]
MAQKYSCASFTMIRKSSNQCDVWLYSSMSVSFCRGAIVADLSLKTHRASVGSLHLSSSAQQTLPDRKGQKATSKILNTCVKAGARLGSSGQAKQSQALDNQFQILTSHNLCAHSPSATLFVSQPGITLACDSLHQEYIITIKPSSLVEQASGRNYSFGKDLATKLHICAMLCTLQDDTGTLLLKQMDKELQDAPLMAIVNNQAPFATALDMAVALAFHLAQLTTTESQLVAVRLLRLFQRRFSQAFTIALCRTHPTVLQRMATRDWNSERERKLHTQRLTLFLHMAQSLAHESSCEALWLLLGSEFFKYALASDRDPEDFKLAVRLLAALAHADVSDVSPRGILPGR